MTKKLPKYKHQNFLNFIIGIFAAGFILYVHGAIPFLLLPTLAQAVWTMGFSESMANGSLFDFYARDFGIPNPAAISFGLAGAWPASLFIRLGLHAADAYTVMVAFWLLLATFAAYRIACRFGCSKLIALLGALIWMTMPIIWTHAAYSMLSLGISLLSFYFLSAFKLFLISGEENKSSRYSVALYPVTTIVSVFMDGYTFMMFAVGSSILLAYQIIIKNDIRKRLINISMPVHAISFALAYALYSRYIGKSNFEAETIDFFRGWGVDLSFLVMPTKGVLWLPDFLGFSIERSDTQFFGDASVWVATFALPILIFGFISWLRVRSITKISTGILIVSAFGMYMALGPSLKINSVKPEALRQSHPGQLSALMSADYAVAPTGNAWLSENLPGFKVMRASYRWVALGVFTMWLLSVIFIAKSSKKQFVFGSIFIILIFNMPDIKWRWHTGIENRIMFQQIDQDLVVELERKIRPKEVVVFIPWGNDFIANYLAPKVGFRTFNIGGDKNLNTAKEAWPDLMNKLSGDIDSNKAISSLKLLINGSTDVIVIPYFHMLWSPHIWPCERGTVNPVFLCPAERRAELKPVIAALKLIPYVDVEETDLFATIRLRSDLNGHNNRLALHSRAINESQYPITISPDFLGAPYIMHSGWYGLESEQVWSKSEATLLLPKSHLCKSDACNARLSFFVFGASPKRPVDVFFESAEKDWKWLEKIEVSSDDLIYLNVPLSGVTDFRTIKLRIPAATSPKRLIGSPDVRTLGIALQRIELIKP